MSVLPVAEVRLFHVTPRRNVAGIILIAFFVIVPLSAIGWAQKTLNSPQCDTSKLLQNQFQEDFVHCVASSLEDGATAGIVSDTVLRPPLDGYLSALSHALAYQATPGDINKIKGWSQLLKSDPVRYRAAIAKLDNAIASELHELRPSLSMKLLVARLKPPAGTNIYPEFIQQKLEFLRISCCRIL